MLLYHAGFEYIRQPDVHYGRKNADFGQGFYLTAEEEFAHRWAKLRKDQKTIVNVYELEVANLCVHTFQRDAAWFQYIYGNRHGKADALEADVVIGPIANDTIYDTLGIITSGFLSPEESMELLMIGPTYQQITLKSERAVQQLRWLRGDVLTEAEVASYRQQVEAEQVAYQNLLAAKLEELTEG